MDFTDLGPAMQAAGAEEARKMAKHNSAEIEQINRSIVRLYRLVQELIERVDQLDGKAK